MIRQMVRVGWVLLSLGVSAEFVHARANSAPAPAATPASAPAATPASAPMPEERQLLHIGVGGGTLVELPGPAATVFAADPNIAKVQPASATRLFVIGVGAGVTTIIATTKSGRPIEQFTVLVGGGVAPTAARAGGGSVGSAGAPMARAAPVIAASAINQAIQAMIPGAEGIEARRVGNAIALTGIAQTPAVAAQAIGIVHAYETGVPVIDRMAILSSIQVNVQVRVAEVSRTLIRQLGFNWQALGQGLHWQFGLLTGLASAGTIGAQTPLNAGDQLGATYSSPSGRWNATSVINALAQNNLVTMLAEPNLTVESGHSASFLSGGEYPIPVPSSGSNTISIEYKKYGVSLIVQPVVLSPNRISLKIEPEVSALDAADAVTIAGVSVPALTTQRATTTVELGSGQSFAIAGLLDSTMNQTGSGVPGISSIPVLGALFDSTNFQRKSEELVIIVTPYLVRPVNSPADLKSPTAGFTPATSLEQILFGHELPVGDGDGAPFDPGFVME
jgi:pilus assembly protein CpaC